MHPRLIVIQPSHERQDEAIQAGQFALHHSNDGNPYRRAIGPNVRLCILARRMVAREIYRGDDSRTITSYDPASEEFRRIERLARERQISDQPYYTTGPELLIHIHSVHAWKGLATYYASSITAVRALMDSQIFQYEHSVVEPRHPVVRLGLERHNARRFEWYGPVWRRTTSTWRGAHCFVNDIEEFLLADRLTEAAA